MLIGPNDHPTFGAMYTIIKGASEPIRALFSYPADIRKTTCTTNAIESLNSVICKAIKKRTLFPTCDSAKKIVYLAIRQAPKKWKCDDVNKKLENWTQSIYG